MIGHVYVWGIITIPTYLQLYSPIRRNVQELGVRGSWSECHFVFSLVYQLCLAL